MTTDQPAIATSPFDAIRNATLEGREYWSARDLMPYHAGRDEVVAGDPTVRIKPKGLAELHKRLGGSGQLALMEAVS